MDQDTVIKPGRPHARNLMAVRERFACGASQMDLTKMTPGPDRDEFLYKIDSYRDRLNTSTPLEGSTDWQYENLVLQDLSPGYESIRRAHLERRNFGLANN